MTNKLLALLLAFFSFTFIFPAQAHAQVTWLNMPACRGNEAERGPVLYDTGDGDQVATLRGIECLFILILNTTINFIGVAILLMLVFGAYRIMMSGGDPKNVEAGKNTITYSILGLIIAISAWSILSLIARITGNESILTFSFFFSGS